MNSAFMAAPLHLSRFLTHMVGGILTGILSGSLRRHDDVVDADGANHHRQIAMRQRLIGNEIAVAKLFAGVRKGLDACQIGWIQPGSTGARIPFG